MTRRYPQLMRKKRKSVLLCWCQMHFFHFLERTTIMMMKRRNLFLSTMVLQSITPLFLEDQASQIMLE